MAFREGAEALPPLTEKIERGAAGGHEFEWLMNQLLLAHADKNQFVYTPAEGAGGDGGIDGVAQDGIPGMDGAVALFKWLWADIHKGGNAAQIKDALSRASKGKTELKHWVLVTPRDIKPSEREWLHSLKNRRGLEVQPWGQGRIEQLLRQCPALFARYYSHAARAYLPGYEGTDFAALSARHREKVVLDHDRLKTIGIPPEARPRESRIELPLDKLFISSRLVPDQSDARPLDLARALVDSRLAVILADPGMGKSTLLLTWHQTHRSPPERSPTASASTRHHSLAAADWPAGADLLVRVHGRGHLPSPSAMATS